ncbi:hypothetical protein WH87_09370 [Devosia epidermidihirudinis]|uniref:DNA 3'-5' helicase n=1 Tax=Devosia epidermidihirudinis TaxID=1293439 RepID=A0A0F5QCZ3_9HYPH|nr:double-strand break repair helicase AddA [Devosia epidermidihirudinis]KKC37874.1 hypothetical protein WH87_09370 [Devosia epidermidihirudinis]
MRGQLRVPAQTSANQARAADPKWSIWVEANAGSGKTYVLTRRVLRLLLADVAPQTILCLTYTKAAAAEMRRRVAKELAQWAVMETSALEAELVGIEGPGFDPALLDRARTLFAKALETPGGLKIVTIHAFCESVLHRFPLEAGVPFDFAVIEDDEREAMVLAAREAVLAEGLGVEGAVETLFVSLSDSQIGDAIREALSDGRKLKAVLADVDTAKANLRRFVGTGTETPAVLNQKLISESLLSPLDLREAVQLFEGDPNGSRRFIDLIARIDPDAMTATGLRAAFLTDKGPRAQLLTAKQQASYPHIFQRFVAEQERIVALDAAIAGAQLVQRSEALLDVIAAIAERYERQKRSRSLLDFDDLVERLAHLFETDAADWVRYKLDAGIDHILVDESQDTNGEQWRVVKAIAEEFFAGEGAVTRPRSLFAVGDQKQSIYSFQGAEPALFGETGAEFGRRAEEAGMLFQPLPLHTSFRTLPEILKAVDLVSDQHPIQAALLSRDKVHHDTARVMTGGSVTLWPPLQQQSGGPASGEWPIEPVEAEQTAPRQVATRIAREIRFWIESGRALSGRGRAVTADDVLILVQSRSTLFQEVIRALRRENLPTPGTDRLKVTGHIAVMDLLAVCDVLLNPADDLQLAAVLRSPLFDVSDDELLEIANPRASGQSLWSAMEGSQLPHAIDAAATLGRWRSELDFERPFEFLTAVLYAEGGLRRFHARLGTEVDEVFAELLDLALSHEQGSQPSLQGFVAEMRRRDVSIKRDLADTGAGVRVMTVHGAKGLEAPIVILADATSKPSGKQKSRPSYVLSEAPGPLLIHAAGDKQHVLETREKKQEIEANLEQEYWRKLYVGMTRAEDELYVTGALNASAKPETQLEGSWYAAIETALLPLSTVTKADDGTVNAIIYPATWAAQQPHAPSGRDARDVVGLRFEPLAAHKAVPIVTPSAASTRVAPLQALDSAAEQVRDADAARKDGIALHALLQHLGRVEKSLWPQVVPKALQVLLGDAPERHAAIGAHAMSILTRPELAELFGPNSRAEVPFLINGQRDGQDIRIAGRMDRLVVNESDVLVVDYKSDAAVPTSPSAVPNQYRTQLGLYALVAGQLFPGRSVRVAILWTQLESLMNLPLDDLAADISGFTMR